MASLHSWPCLYSQPPCNPDLPALLQAQVSSEPTASSAALPTPSPGPPAVGPQSTPSPSAGSLGGSPCRSHSQSPASPAAALKWDGGPVNQTVGEHWSKRGVWSRDREQENGRGSAGVVLGPLHLTKISSVKGDVKQG